MQVSDRYWLIHKFGYHNRHRNISNHKLDRANCESSKDVSQLDRNLCWMGEAAASLLKVVEFKERLVGWCFLLRLFPHFRCTHTCRKAGAPMWNIMRRVSVIYSLCSVYSWKGAHINNHVYLFTYYTWGPLLTSCVPCSTKRLHINAWGSVLRLRSCLLPQPSEGQRRIPQPCSHWDVKVCVFVCVCTNALVTLGQRVNHGKLETVESKHIWASDLQGLVCCPKQVSLENETPCLNEITCINRG